MTSAGSPCTLQHLVDELIASLGVSTGRTRDDLQSETRKELVRTVANKLKLSTGTIDSLWRMSHILCAGDKATEWRKLWSTFRAFDRDTLLRSLRSERNAKDYIPLEFLESFAAMTATLKFYFGILGGPEMKAQNGPMFSRISMTDGWAIVSEVLKFRAYNLQRTCPDIPTSAVESNLISWCRIVVQEVLVWMYMRTLDSSFQEDITLPSEMDSVLDDVVRKLYRNMTGKDAESASDVHHEVDFECVRKWVRSRVTMPQLECLASGEAMRRDTGLSYEKVDDILERLGCTSQQASIHEQRAESNPVVKPTSVTATEERAQRSQPAVQSLPENDASSTTSTIAKSKRTLRLRQSSRRLRRRLSELGSTEPNSELQPSNLSNAQSWKSQVVSSGFFVLGGEAPNDVLLDRVLEEKARNKRQSDTLRQWQPVARREQEEQHQTAVFEGPSRPFAAGASSGQPTRPTTLPMWIRRPRTKANRGKPTQDDPDHRAQPRFHQEPAPPSLQNAATQEPTVLPPLDENAPYGKLMSLRHKRRKNGWRPYQSPYEIQSQHGTNLQEMRNALLGYPVGYERFDLDNPESDNEELPLYSVEYGARRRFPINSFRISDQALDLDFEILLACMTFWVVDPNIDEGYKPSMSVMFDDNTWLSRFLQENEHLMRRHAALCQECTDYANPMKCILYIEMHFVIRGALTKTFPAISNGPTAYAKQLEIAKKRWYQFVVKKAQKTPLLLNMKCNSLNRRLNKQVVDNIRGMHDAIAFFRKNTASCLDRPDSRFMLVGIRSICYDDEDVDYYSHDREIDRVALRVFANRAWLEDWAPRPQDRLFLYPLESLTIVHRMFRGVHDVCRANFRFQDILFGNIIPQSPQYKGFPCSVPREVTTDATMEECLRVGVDEGCLAYLDKLQPFQCDSSQKKALLTSLKEMGNLDVGSSSVSLVVGPPGTGKTTCIKLLIAALMNHSSAGHLCEGAVETNYACAEDGAVRFMQHCRTHESMRHLPLRILVCCSSNQAVDNIARRLREGIPDGNGGSIVPETVRVGRFKYDYQGLEDMSIVRKALEIDRYLFELAHRDEEGKDIPEFKREKPSSRAKKLLARECIVVLSTASSSCSSVFKELQTTFDVLIIDEGSHARESEAMIPISAMARTLMKGSSRMHVVLFGDHLQLPPVYVSEHFVKEFLWRDKSCRFNVLYEEAILSMFERLLTYKRCPVSWLSRQYRMHPIIGSIHSKLIYGDKVTQPEDSVRYTKRYNNLDTSEFAPFTFVDTRQCLNRFETRHVSGSFENEFEAAQINRILRSLDKFNRRREQDGSLPLAGQIFVTSPYKSQVAFIADYLSRGTRYLSLQSTRREMDIVIDTVDALQGAERSIVIVSPTRSNRKNIIGFLRDKRRINVAASRAKYLLILVGDGSTVCARSEVLRQYWLDCFSEGNGAKVQFVEPKRKDRDERNCAEVKAMTSRIYRNRESYDLRHNR